MFIITKTNNVGWWNWQTCPTIDRLVSTALHWFRTDLSTVLAVFTTKSFGVKRLSARCRWSFSASNRQRQGEIFTTTI